MIDQFTIRDEDGVYHHTFLSNFFPSIIDYDGITYPSVEHFFQAMKTKDYALREKIATTSDAGQAKKLGRKLELREDWEALKIPVMRHALEKKFSKGSKLGEMLLDTGDEILVENASNWGDKFWGKVNGRGQNWLGILLMARRAELRGK